MKVHFSKYHGAGNDFIMLDGRKSDLKFLTNKVIAKMCNRHMGIGADGLIILAHSKSEDFKMIYFNSDGYPGSMCGNGGRCITAFAWQLRIINGDCTFEAADGLHTAAVANNGLVSLSLRDVPQVKKMEDGIFLNTGSPHLIIFGDNIDNTNVVGEGRRIRSEARFPEGTNVNFVEATPSGIKVRTYERGVEDETLSCGTGVTAAAIASCIGNGKRANKVKVETKGGKLSVEFKAHPDGTFTNLKLTGPAVKVFEGLFEI